MKDELSPDLQDIIAAERSRPTAPVDAKKLARAGLATLLGPAAGLGAPPTPMAKPLGGGDAGGAKPVDAARAGTATGAVRAGASGLAKLAGAFVLGGTVTAGVLTGVRTPDRPTPVPSVTAASTPAVATVASSPSPAWTSLLPSTSVPSGALPASTSAAATPPISPQPSTPTSHDLASERALLERARSALARGDGAGALAALDRHAREYMSGQLAEEREALSIQALSVLDRQGEGRARAERFRAAYPRSVFLPMIDEVLR